MCDSIEVSCHCTYTAILSILLFNFIGCLYECESLKHGQCPVTLVLLQALTDSPDASALDSVADTKACNRVKLLTAMMAGTDCAPLHCTPAFASCPTKSSNPNTGHERCCRQTTACWGVSYPAFVVWSTACAPLQMTGSQTHNSCCCLCAGSLVRMWCECCAATRTV